MGITDRELFELLHSDLPREGPGSEASANRVLKQLSLPEQPTVLDVACGPGRQTLHLAATLPDATICAFDIRPAFAAILKHRVAEAGLRPGTGSYVQVADMAAPPFKDHTFDLIWCEGAAYIIGVEHALQIWHPLLREGAYLAFTELTWLREPDRHAREWWQERYPSMRTATDWLPAIEQAGYQVVDHFPLPDEDWWPHYYLPLQTRIEQLTQAHGDHPVLTEAREEIELRQRYPDDYGYSFFVLRAAPST